MEREIAYNLYQGLEKFMEEVKRNGFDFEKLRMGNYKIRKKVTPTQNRIVGNIFEAQFLIIYSSLSPFDVKYQRAISQLEKIADDFVIQ
jgi:hypothetical protein